MMYKLILMKKFELNQIFEPLKSGKLIHFSPIWLIIVILILSIVIFACALFFEMKL